MTPDPTSERCPTCEGTRDEPGTDRIGAGDQTIEEDCPDPFHSTPSEPPFDHAAKANAIVDSIRGAVDFPPSEPLSGSGEERGCLICGADHPRMAPHRPGEITRLRSLAARYKAERDEQAREWADSEETAFQYLTRAEAAEQARDEAREALREVMRCPVNTGSRQYQIAKQAFAALQTPEQEETP